MGISTPLSKEKKNEINENLGLTLTQITKDLDKSRKLISLAIMYEKKAEELEIKLAANLDKSQINDIKIEIDFFNLIRLIEFRLLIGLLYVDLLTLVKVYLKAEYKYEELFSLRQVNVILTEGLKKIYHFKEEHRKDTFWAKDIKLIIQNDLPDLESDYNSLTTKINEYILKFSTEESQDQRNLSVHYDVYPSKVYDMIVKLDTEKVYLFMLPFVDLLKNLFEFTHKIQISYSLKNKYETEEIEREFDKKNKIVIDIAKKHGFDLGLILKFEKLIEEIKLSF